MHHLKNPQKGLNIVNDVQLEDGGAALMVYGKFGRTPVYQIQTLLKIIHGQNQSISNEIHHTKNVLSTLPQSNIFHQFNEQDIRLLRTIELYDLLLHKRDVSYNVYDLYQWSNLAGYYLVDFSVVENMIPISLSMDDRRLAENLEKHSKNKRQLIGEIVHGNMKMHDIYLSKQLNSEARFDVDHNVVYAYGFPMGFRNVINERSNYHRRRPKPHWEIWG